MGKLNEEHIVNAQFTVLSTSVLPGLDAVRTL